MTIAAKTNSNSTPFIRRAKETEIQHNFCLLAGVYS
jgi:hypothetical protein